MRVSAVVLAVVALAMISGCAPPDEETLPFEEQVREAVFRYQFEHHTSAVIQSAAFYYLEVEDGADPSDELLAQFEGHSPPVKALSSSIIEEDTGWVVDQETGKQGVLFRITGVKWPTTEKAEVRGGFYVANIGSEGWSYTVELSSGTWTVTFAERKYIS